MDKILVTGAAGMVGSHVVDLLRGRGHNVVGLGRLGGSRGADDYTDLRDSAATLLAFKQHKPTHVFHAAACVYGIIGNMNRPGRSFLENLQINTNVIEAAHQVGVKKVTAMGTGCVYPFPPVSTPLKESDIFMGRPHPSESGYAHAKLAMLAMLETYEQYGMDWAYVVSCNLFGPRDKFDPVNGHVVPALIRKFYEAKRDNTDVSVWGDGSAKRDFIYVKDAARAIETVMERGRGPINMGTDSVWRIGDIVDTLVQITGLPEYRVSWDIAKPNGVDYRGYDLSRLNALGFKPRYTIAEGLYETWEWYNHEQAK